MFKQTYMIQNPTHLVLTDHARTSRRCYFIFGVIHQLMHAWSVCLNCLLRTSSTVYQTVACWWPGSLFWVKVCVERMWLLFARYKVETVSLCQC